MVIKFTGTEHGWLFVEESRDGIEVFKDAPFSILTRRMYGNGEARRKTVEGLGYVSWWTPIPITSL
jgi:hypothetical protein